MNKTLWIVLGLLGGIIVGQVASSYWSQAEAPSRSMAKEADTPKEERQMKQPATHLHNVDVDTVDWKTKDNNYWKEALTSEQFAVCRQGGTERAFTGLYNDFKEKGMFACSNCGLPLFSSETKFDSGTGWPSFYQTLNPQAVELLSDDDHGMRRTEVRCARCGAHLGHVFDDGPNPTGKRYCINSVCLLHESHLSKER